MSVWDDLAYEQQAAAMGIDTARRYLPPEMRYDGPAPLQPIDPDLDLDAPSRLEAENEL